MAVACPVDMPEGAHCLRGQDSAQAHYLIVMPAQWTPSVLRSKFIEPIGTGQCRLRRGPTSPCRLVSNRMSFDVSCKDFNALQP